MAATDRVAALDLIRGVAVLGILAVNIAAFAGPPASAVTPHALGPASLADEIAFAAVFLMFEGKMRALFSILFGASMLLFIDRAEENQRDGDLLQLRRLGWLMLFGLAHFFLLWPGDILFLYGACGIAALFMRELSTKALVATALILFAGWHLGGGIANLGDVVHEERVRSGSASTSEAKAHETYLTGFHGKATGDLAHARTDLTTQVITKLRERLFHPFQSVLVSIGETLPLILIGMALYRSGFFAGNWPRPLMWRAAALGLTAGGALTIAILAWLWARHFPPAASLAALLYWTALPHLMMALAYAALLVLAAPRLSATRGGALLCKAGRMAFSNYIGTTVLMTAIFYGWGLGLIGRFGTAAQLAFVLLGWASMLAFSAAWLAHFRQGPLEWLWRSLTELRPIPLQR